MMYGNLGQMPSKNIKIVVTESKIGKSITPSQRALFVENHWYSANWPTSRVLRDFRAYVTSGCSPDYEETM